MDLPRKWFYLHDQHNKCDHLESVWLPNSEVKVVADVAAVAVVAVEAVVDAVEIFARLPNVKWTRNR